MKLFADRYCCYFCGIQCPPVKSEKKKFRNLIEVHHIKEKNEGGSDSAINLVPCCSNCHSKIHLGLIKIDAWYNIGYYYKLKWTNEAGSNQFGPSPLLPLVRPASSENS